MSCEPLSGTGSAANLGVILLLASIVVVAGAAILFLYRQRRRSALAAVALLLLLGAATWWIGTDPSAPAELATPGCTSSNRDFTVIQTSTMEGLAPGIAPVPITGRVVNRSQHGAYVTAVEVEISSIDNGSGPGSSEGACTRSDYVLGGPRMRVERSLEPGGSTTFSGASLGFANRVTNQDACQGATIHLLYTANPD